MVLPDSGKRGLFDLSEQASNALMVPNPLRPCIMTSHSAAKVGHSGVRTTRTFGLNHRCSGRWLMYRTVI